MKPIEVLQLYASKYFKKESIPLNRKFAREGNQELTDYYSCFCDISVLTPEKIMSIIELLKFKEEIEKRNYRGEIQLSTSSDALEILSNILKEKFEFSKDEIELYKRSLAQIMKIYFSKNKNLKSLRVWIDIEDLYRINEALSIFPSCNIFLTGDYYLISLEKLERLWFLHPYQLLYYLANLYSIDISLPINFEVIKRERVIVHEISKTLKYASY